MPVIVPQQDWGAALGFDAAALWNAWAPERRHDTVAFGHFMAEEGSDGRRQGDPRAPHPLTLSVGGHDSCPPAEYLDGHSVVPGGSR